MNWRRGCFRLWVVGSALFVIAIAAITSSEIKTQFENLDLSAAHPAYPWTMLLNAIGIAVGIPLVALILGAAIGWAFSGFKASTSTTGRRLYHGA